MNVMILGGGGRENALAKAANTSPLVDTVYCFGPSGDQSYKQKRVWMYVIDEPGDLGIAQRIEIAKSGNVGLVLVGPENFLAAGAVDQFRAAGLTIFGPTQEASRLESSKVFAKEVMASVQVPTAPAVVYGQKDLIEILRFILHCHYPTVVKADGLAAGKGVAVCRDLREAMDAVHRCLIAREFGSAGDVILLENFLDPHPVLPRAELSVMALVDIHGNFIPLLPAQDYKPVNIGDQGPNTGGMGAFAPIPWVTAEMMAEISERIFKPTIMAMIRRGTPFSGVLYAGLMWTADGPKVVEFNVRFGDPELQAVWPLLQTDLIPILLAIAKGESIAGVKLEWHQASSVCVNLVSRGYPGKFQTGLDIFGLDRLPCNEPDLTVFHAATRLRAGEFLETNGGRVLNIVGRSAKGLNDAAYFVQQYARLITFGGKHSDRFTHYRKDIGDFVPQSLA